MKKPIAMNRLTRNCVGIEFNGFRENEYKAKNDENTVFMKKSVISAYCQNLYLDTLC